LHEEKAGKYLFRVLYIYAINVFSYQVLKDTNFLSWELGGKGSYWNIFTPRDYPKNDPYLKEYYIIVTGYHLAQLIVHFASEKRNDFIEMALHHLVTIMLVFGSYLCNVWKCGAIIAYLHDFSDIFGNTCKLLGNFNTH